MLISEITARSQVEIIAHRGASWLAPENTVASANLAWEKGADAVEVDIYLSKDNKIICSHDATTKRTSGRDYRIADTESRILRKLDVGTFKDEMYKGEKIPFLKEIIRTVPPGKELVVEIKCKSEILPYLQKVIRKNSNNRNFTFICFDFQTIADTNPAMLWISKEHSAFRTWFNERWHEFRGHSLETECGEGWMEGIHPEDRLRCGDAAAIW